MSNVEMNDLLLPIPPLGDPSCWGGDFTYVTCCTGMRTDCWQGSYTAERCCGPAWAQVWDGRPSCFMYGGASYEDCCVTGANCGYLKFASPTTCCGLQSMLKQAGDWSAATSIPVRQNEHLWLILLLAVPCLLRAMWPAAEKPTKERGNMMATLLRAQAAVMTLPLHSRLNKNYATPMWTWLLLEYSRTHNFIWFVVSSHLAVVQGMRRPLQKERRLRQALLNVSTALLRRTARLVPVFALTQLLFPILSQLTSVMRALYPQLQELPSGSGRFFSPGFWLLSSQWVFKAEFVCSAAVLCLTQTLQLFGRPTTVAVAVAGLALGQQLRLPVPHSHRTLATHFHFRVLTGNLPMCLWTFMFSLVLDRGQVAPETRTLVRGAAKAGVLLVLQMGILATGVLDWGYYSGHFDPLPQWPQPIFTNVFLVFGCTLALTSFQGQDSEWAPLLKKLDPLFPAFNIVHPELYRHLIIADLNDWQRLCVELPAWCFWSLLFSFLVHLVTEPYQEAGLRLLRWLEAQAQGTGWGATAAWAALVSAASLILAHYLREL